MMSRVRSVSLAISFVACVAGPVLGQTPARTPAGQPQQSGATAAQPAVDPLAFPTYETTLGYQLLRVPDQTFPFGLNVDGAWNWSPALGLVGEIGWAYDSQDDVNFHAWNFGAGPRFTLRPEGNIWPFAQVLVGGLHMRASADGDSESATRFMIQPGAGAYFNAGDGWGIVGQVDYRRVFLDEDEDGESGENEFRVFVGLRLLLD